MVSIGKLAAGQAKYYLDQAGTAVSRSSGVSSGVEDYYLRGHEPAGQWIGRSAAALGVAGEVAATGLETVLGGEHPDTGAALRTRGRVPGFDVTFSAPKSVSVLFGVAGDGVCEAVRRAHEAAVAQAFAYLERHVASGRRGAGGAERMEGVGLIGAAFLHRTSRAGDPHLHTHVLVANLVLGRDGRWSALDGRLLYAHAKTASYLYQAALRAELSRELGVSWEPVRRASPRSTASRIACAAGSRAGVPRSRPSSRARERKVLAPPRPRRCRRGGLSATACGRSGCATNGDGVPGPSVSATVPFIASSIGPPGNAALA
jgi:conjugative relaxase-like TrwC/TraI family protein